MSECDQSFYHVIHMYIRPVPGMDAKWASPGPSGSFLFEENPRTSTLDNRVTDMIEILSPQDRSLAVPGE